MKRIVIFLLAFSVALVFAGCASTAKLEIIGNQSVGDGWECSVSPEGIVRVVSSKYHILLPLPGMPGKFVFKFEAVTEGEAEVHLTHYFRGTPGHTVIYMAVVDRRKALTLTVVMSENADEEDDISSSIGDYEFHRKRLASAAIPDSVISIGKYAFSENRLTVVAIPDSVISIGEHAFENNRLASVTIPDSVTSIGDYAFSRNRLDNVTIGNSVTRIGDGAFSRNRLTSVTIPDSVTIIQNGAFRENQLTSLTIGNNVRTIGGHAFYKNRLTSVTIPDSVTSIGRDAFNDNQLTSITIGVNVKLGLATYSSFPNGFDDAYANNESRAGTYTYSGGAWNLKP